MTKLISTDLTILDPAGELLNLFNADNGLDPLIAEAEAMATELMKNADVSTKKGRDAIASNAHNHPKGAVIWVKF